MKRTLSLLLVLIMVLFLFAGCGGARSEERTEVPMVAATIQPNVAAAPATEPTIEPTLSAQERIYNSLPDRMKQAVNVGIVELSQLEDLNRECTIEEAAQMLQNAYTLRNGTESRLLADVLTMDCVGEPAYLGWIGRLPIPLFVEAQEPENYESYDQWLDYSIGLSESLNSLGIADMVSFYNGSDGYSYWDGEDLFVRHSYGW